MGREREDAHHSRRVGKEHLCRGREREDDHKREKGRGDEGNEGPQAREIGQEREERHGMTREEGLLEREALFWGRGDHCGGKGNLLAWEREDQSEVVQMKARQKKQK